MTLLTAADLVYMQDTQAEAMPGTVVIQRYVGAPDGMGGAVETWAAVGTVIGRIYPELRRGMAESVGGAQIISAMEWFGTLPVGTDVIAQDRLFYSSRTWEVKRVNNDEMWQTCVRCELESFNEEDRV